MSLAAVSVSSQAPHGSPLPGYPTVRGSLLRGKWQFWSFARMSTRMTSGSKVSPSVTVRLARCQEAGRLLASPGKPGGRQPVLYSVSEPIAQERDNDASLLRPREQRG